MMSDRKVIPMSERLQIVYFLLWKVKIISTFKVILLCEILYCAKGSINRLVNSRKKYDFCSRLLKISNYSLENENIKNDVLDVLLVLKEKGFILVEGTKIKLLKEFDGFVLLNYLSDSLIFKLSPFINMSEESFIEEVLKYAKSY